MGYRAILAGVGLAFGLASATFAAPTPVAKRVATPTKPKRAPIVAETAATTEPLRAGTLGQGRVVLRQEAKAVLVPHDAVQTFRGHGLFHGLAVRGHRGERVDGPFLHIGADPPKCARRQVQLRRRTVCVPASRCGLRNPRT